MPRSEISHEENIVRAIRFADWDEQKRHWSSQIFRGKNISVSRLLILNLEKLLKIFHKQLDRPPNLHNWSWRNKCKSSEANRT